MYKVHRISESFAQTPAIVSVLNYFLKCRDMHVRENLQALIILRVAWQLRDSRLLLCNPSSFGNEQRASDVAPRVSSPHWFAILFSSMNSSISSCRSKKRLSTAPRLNHLTSCGITGRSWGLSEKSVKRIHFSWKNSTLCLLFSFLTDVEEA